MAGCYQTTGELAYTGGGWLNGWGDTKMGMLAGYGHMVRFFTSFDWWKATPANSLVTSYEGADYSGISHYECGDEGSKANRTAPALCLAEHGRAYAVYLPAGGKASVQIAPGSYKIRGYDPRNGVWTREWAECVEAELWITPAVEGNGDYAYLLLASEPCGCGR